MGANDAGEMLAAAAQEVATLDRRVAELEQHIAHLQTTVSEDNLAAVISGQIRDGVFAARDAGESLYPASERIAHQVIATVRNAATSAAKSTAQLPLPSGQPHAWIPGDRIQRMNTEGVGIVVTVGTLPSSGGFAIAKLGVRWLLGPHDEREDDEIPIETVIDAGGEYVRWPRAKDFSDIQGAEAL